MTRLMLEDDRQLASQRRRRIPLSGLRKAQDEVQQLRYYGPTQVGPVRELFALSEMGDLKHILIPAVDELSGTFSVTNGYFLD